jgi:hypothetical protein
MSCSGHPRLVQQSIAGPPLGVDRLASVQNDGDDTTRPDKDVYVETILNLNPDRSGPPGWVAHGRLPLGLVVGEVYEFGAWSAVEQVRLVALADAVGLAAAELAAAEALDTTPSRVPGAGSVSVATLVAASVDAGAAAVPAGTSALKWLASCAGGGASYGSVVTGVISVAGGEARALHVMPDGTTLFVEGGLFEPRCPVVAMIFPVFLEIFSGSGAIGRALPFQGLTVLAWEIEIGPQYVLRKRDWQLLIFGWTRTGAVWGIHLGTPCRGRPLTRPLPLLQSEAFPYGLPAWAPPCVVKKVKEGNAACGGLTRQADMLLLCPALLDQVQMEVERAASLLKSLRQVREEQDAAMMSSTGRGKGKDSRP